jgi:queuine tRNA-ribosyltransferase
MSGEMLGPVLLSIHNVTYYQRLMGAARAAIEADRFVELRAEKLQGWRVSGSDLQ